MNDENQIPEIPSEEDIQARFDSIKAKLDPLTENPELDARVEAFLGQEPIAPVPTELELEAERVAKKLNGLDERLNKAKTTYQNTKPSPNSVSGGLDQKTALGMGLGLSMAYTIIGAPLLGYGLGLLINNATGNPGWHIWTTLIFSIIAVAWVAMIGSRNNDRL